MTNLGKDMYDEFLNDVKNNSFIGVSYADTWGYEDEYSHNDIEVAREEFINKVNNYFKENDMPYIMREVTENAWVCNLDGNIIHEQNNSRLN